MRLARPVVAFLALAVWITWPAVLHPVAAVPGAERSDLWDGLWSFWYVAERLATGALPTRVDGLLNHPDGGTLWVADPLNALLAAPFVHAFGPAAAWSVLSTLHVAFAGLMARLLTLALTRSEPAAWFAGVVYASSPMLAAHLHNGATEAVGAGWLPLAVWACLRARDGGTVRVLLAGAALATCTVAHWYFGVCAFAAAGCIVVFGGSSSGGGGLAAPRNAPRRGVLLALVVGAALAAPVAVGTHRAATAPDNVVGIKDARELATVRRTIGPADPVAFVAPLDYRSPDFRELSRYGEQYVHAPYLGWVALLLACAGALQVARGRLGAAEPSAAPSRRGAAEPSAAPSGPGVDRRGLAAVGAAGVACAVLACGPVLARFGGPVILPGRLAVPLPYFLLEGLPGFASLSLVWRLAQGAALAVAVMAAVPLVGLGSMTARHPDRRTLGGLSTPGLMAGLAALLVLVETRTFAPTAGLPAHADASPESPLAVLAGAPDGAVMNYPVTGGLSWLHDQTIHGKPLTGGLNFPNNKASRKLWRLMIDHASDAPEGFASTVGAAASGLGVRYVVVRLDPNAPPDMHDAAVRALKHASPPIAEAPGLRVHRLY